MDKNVFIDVTISDGLNENIGFILDVKKKKLYTDFFSERALQCLISFVNFV